MQLTKQQAVARFGMHYEVISTGVSYHIEERLGAVPEGSKRAVATLEQAAQTMRGLNQENITPLATMLGVDTNVATAEKPHVAELPDQITIPDIGEGKLYVVRRNDGEEENAPPYELSTDVITEIFPIAFDFGGPIGGSLRPRRSPNAYALKCKTQCGHEIKISPMGVLASGLRYISDFSRFDRTSVFLSPEAARAHMGRQKEALTSEFTRVSDSIDHVLEALSQQATAEPEV